MTRRPDRSPRGDWMVASLESRCLPAAGLGGALAAELRDLGTVARGAALAGAEATATVAPGGAVTFRFAIEAAGDYTLRVRHDGDGLSLVARTPAGAAAIDPGPAGPFRGVALALDAATYEVTASAVGGGPVFVDWELLLNSGVGQAPAATPGVVLPLPALAPGPVPSAPAVAPVAAAARSAWAGSDPAGVGSPPPQAMMYPVVGSTLGRPVLSPPAASGNTPAPAPEAASFAPIEVALTGTLQMLTPAARPPDLASAVPPGATDAAAPVLATGPLDPPAADLAGDPWWRPGLIGPGLCLGGAAVALGVRLGARRPGPATPREVVRDLLGRAGGLDPRGPAAPRPILPPLPDEAG